MSSRAKRPDRAHHDWVSLAVPMGAAHLLVPGLQPHTQYQFSVLAQNKLGSGPFSKIVLSVPEGERPLNPEQQTRMGKSWQGKPGYGRAWGLEGFVEDDPDLFRGSGKRVGHRRLWKARRYGEGHWRSNFCCACLPFQGFLPHQLSPGFP